MLFSTSIYSVAQPVFDSDAPGSISYQYHNLLPALLSLLLLLLLLLLSCNYYYFAKTELHRLSQIKEYYLHEHFEHSDSCLSGSIGDAVHSIGQ